MEKRHRLRASADFQRVRDKGCSSVHPLFVLFRLPNGLEESRFGFSVGRRLGSAVWRNRLKRQMREILRRRMDSGEILQGWDVVLIARRPAREASFCQLDEVLGSLLRRAGLSRDNL